LVFFALLLHFFVADELDVVGIIASVISAALIALLSIGFGLIATGAILATQSSKDKGMFGEHTLEITDEGLLESTEVNKLLHRWLSSFRIRETRRYVLIFVNEGICHIVPLTSSPLEGSVGEFLEELRVQIRENQTSETSKRGLNP
jgi:hypothetical protein